MRLIHTHSIFKKQLADMITPVGLYHNLRKIYPGSVLLESNDFASLENCRSFIGLSPLAIFKAKGREVEIKLHTGANLQFELEKNEEVLQQLKRFTSGIQCEGTLPKGAVNGIFGHCNFEAVEYFDTHDIPAPEEDSIPTLQYRFYRFLLAFDHLKNELTLIENIPEGENSQLDQLQALCKMSGTPDEKFSLEGAEESNISDADFKKMVEKGKEHCQLGDVFQVVFSRQFSQAYSGDDFNVYRSLRSINPSPYLFYFDFEDYRLFGSSPEAQLVVKDNTASIFPIAETYKRTGDDTLDAENALELSADPKENAEHIMLVDLARNDLSKHGTRVIVAELKKIEFYSHVIHLVSKVEGQLKENADALTVFADTFPAGTLSGAPKFKAIQLIKKYENQARGFYGGAIGMIGLKGDINHAILIRSFLSRNQKLYYQAGAGIVVDSEPESELQEVNNKLGALKQAMEAAEKI
ncbi:MAG: anthranilate synthase component I family protein [Saprospiraceae bacterium]